MKLRLNESITDEAVDSRLTMKPVEIQFIKPTASMVKSMDLPTDLKDALRGILGRVLPL